MITFDILHHGFTPFGDELAKNAASLAAFKNLLDAGGEALSNVIVGPESVILTGVSVNDSAYFDAKAYVMVFPRHKVRLKRRWSRWLKQAGDRLA